MPGPVNNSLATQIEPAEPVITYVGVPIVTVNVATSVTHVPVNLQVFTGPGMAQDMLTIGTVSVGDQMGLGAGSGVNSMLDMPIACNPQCCMGPAPLVSYAQPHLQDLTNGAGMTAIPGQFSVMSAI